MISDANIPFSLTLGKLETQTIGGGVSNLKFFRMMHIYKMATIFRLFPLDFVVDTEKAEGADPEFSVVGVETPTAEG